MRSPSSCTMRSSTNDAPSAASRCAQRSTCCGACCWHGSESANATTAARRAAMPRSSGPPPRSATRRSRRRTPRGTMPRMFAFEVAHGAAIAVAVAILGGMLFAWLVRRQDHRTWVLARAPQLPIRALSSGDDAWLTGTVRAKKPLRCPWFDVPCVAYDYTIEIEVVTTHTDKDGKVHVETSWQTEHSEDDAVDFELDDGASIRVCIDEANNEAMDDLDTDYETSARRHTASVLEIGAKVSALGVVQDDGAFAREREVPLVLTRQAP